MLKKATQIDDIFNAFTPAPLVAEDDFRDFYVNVDRQRDRYISRVEALKQILDRENAKIFFAGHRGSGKSTELNRLKNEIREKTFIVQFSMVEELNIRDINYIDLIMVTMEQIAEQAEAANLLNPESEHLEQIKKWLTKITKVEAKETGYMAEVKAGLKTDRGVLSLVLGLFAEFKAAVKSGSSAKTEYRQRLDRKINILKSYCNILINEVTKNLRINNQNLLIILEDMDKIDPARTHDLFYNNSGVLAELNARIIFTISIFTLTTHRLAELSNRFQDVRLPMIKIYEKGKQKRFKEGIEAIKGIVYQRAELSLFAEGVVEKLILRCGGVLHDLFKMIVTAGQAAVQNGEDQISMEFADYAFEQLKIRYRGMLTDEDKKGITPEMLYDKLMEVSRSQSKTFAIDSILIQLMGSLAVLEYNGEQWFDVHPAVESILQELGKIGIE